MVSILYCRQKQQRERRLQRVSSARKAGALLSVISARSYCEYKQQQKRLVLYQQRKRQEATVQVKLKQIAKAIINAERNRMTAHIMAERHRSFLNNIAKHENNAWAYQKNLQNARYTLAVKMMQHDYNVRNVRQRQSKVYRAKSALMQQNRLDKLKAARHQPSAIQDVMLQFKQNKSNIDNENSANSPQLKRVNKLSQTYNARDKQQQYSVDTNACLHNKLGLQKQSKLQKNISEGKIYQKNITNDKNNSKDNVFLANNDINTDKVVMNVRNDLNDSVKDNEDDGVHTLMHIAHCPCKRRPVIDANKSQLIHDNDKVNRSGNINEIKLQDNCSSVEFHEHATEDDLLQMQNHDIKTHKQHLISNKQKSQREKLLKQSVSIFDKSYYLPQGRNEQRDKKQGVSATGTYQQEQKRSARAVNTQKLSNLQRVFVGNYQKQTDLNRNNRVNLTQGCQLEQQNFSQLQSRLQMKSRLTDTKLNTLQKQITANNLDKQIEPAGIDLWQQKENKVDIERETLQRARVATKAFRQQFLLTHLTSPFVKTPLQKNFNGQSDQLDSFNLHNTIYLPVHTILSSAQISDNLTRDSQRVSKAQTNAFTVQQLDASQQKMQKWNVSQGNNMHKDDQPCDASCSEMHIKHNKHVQQLLQTENSASATQLNISEHCNVDYRGNQQQTVCKSNCQRNDRDNKNKNQKFLQINTRSPSSMTIKINNQQNLNDKPTQSCVRTNNKPFPSNRNEEKSKSCSTVSSSNVLTNLSKDYSSNVNKEHDTNLSYKQYIYNLQDNIQSRQKLQHSLVPVTERENCACEALQITAIDENQMQTYQKLTGFTTANDKTQHETQIVYSNNSNLSTLSTSSLSPSLAITNTTSSSTSTYLQSSIETTSSSSSSSSACSSSLVQSSTILSTSTNSSLSTSTSNLCQTMTAQELRNALKNLRQKL